MNPQLLLICCEGRTEERYFSMLREVFRVSGIDIQIIPCGGQQHRILVDLAIEKRRKIFTSMGIFDSEDDIETWVVCDRDGYVKSFTKLREYGEKCKVSIVFSDPQFENYILQHFGSPNSSRSKGSMLERELTIAMLGYGMGAYIKGDLEWLRDIIDKKPSIVRAAMNHADVFSNHTRKPFFTVQKLVERLLQFSEI